MRIKVKLRDESYTWVPESQDSAKVQGSGLYENREKVVSHEITPFEVGFSSTRVNFCLRVCMCPREMLPNFFSPTP